MSQTPPASFPPAPGTPQPPYGGPGAPPSGSSNSTMTILLIVGGVLLFGGLVCAGILAALLLPAVQAARSAAQRQVSSNNMKQIGLALHNYHDVYKQLPPAFTTDSNGRPMHSWRTAILPFMEQQALYESIDFDKPWDDPANQLAYQSVIPAYQSPSADLDPSLTTYVAIRDPQSIFPGAEEIRFRDVLDGLSNTIFVVEAAPSDAVHWMSPDDIAPDQFLQSASGDRGFPGGGHVLMADGAVRFVASTVDPSLLEAMVTRNGKETIDSPGY